MKLRCSFKKVAKSANKFSGDHNVDLDEHLAETKQDALPQSKIMKDCLNCLTDDGLIDEAYLRGSFGRGHADIHSDIDLFVVCEPEKLEKVYDTVTKYLESNGDIITDCHDRLVEDYGGIGFMFVAKDKAGYVYQFDLYVAMKGIPPQKETMITPRIFSKNDTYEWMKEYGTPQIKELPEKTQDFINRKTAGDTTEDRVELIMQEILLNLFVTNKHLKRGQISRTVIDNQYIVSSTIEMLQTLIQYGSVGYSSVYLGNEVVDIAKKFGDKDMVEAANKLEKFFDQPISQQKLLDVLAYSKFVFEKSCPEKYKQHKKMIDVFELEILTPDASNQNTISKPTSKRMGK